MDDYGKFCYLDVQKTGSTFISALLKGCSHLPLLETGKHSVVNEFSLRSFAKLMTKGKVQSAFTRSGFYRPGVFYFNSVRHPFHYYASLYNYGCDARGGLYEVMKQKELTYFYDGTEDGFKKWVQFLLKPENSHFFGGMYRQFGTTGVGFLTFRFLRLSITNPHKKLPQVTSMDDARALLKRDGISEYTVRNESMREDMLFLIDNHLKQHVSRDKAIEILDGVKINASETKAATPEMLEGTDVGALVQKREALIFENYYND